jgi:hypothetical protein
MAASKTTINPIQSLQFATAETAILQWAACYQSTAADMTAVLPAGAASALKFLGFARYAQVSGATSIELITAGVAAGNAAAAITAGDDLESGGATGTVQTHTAGTIIGRALDSAGAAGDILRIEILKPI